MGLGLPDAFALGAARGSPDAEIIALAHSWEGIRIATVSSPALTSAGILSDFFIIIVSGPGQYFSARAYALGSIFSTRGSISSIEETWTISGLSYGLPLAMKIFFTASLSSAFAASP